MVLITEAMIRKRAEHNDGEIFSLEEISLHQQNITKIVNIDKWCPKLQILYFHDNLISKIENLSRLKELRYLNLALNKIEEIDNLQGCEFLSKLDLTVNVIQDISCVQCLRSNIHLSNLYLMGNPCTDLEGYRCYVITSLPNLKILDGIEVKKSERILSKLNFREVQTGILNQVRKLNLEKKDEKKNAELAESSKIAHMHEKKVEKIIFSEDGRILNVNKAGIDFELIDKDEEYVLDLAIFKYLNTSLIDVDIQTNHVRVDIRGKAFQLALPEEIHPDRSTAHRSSTTGHLVLSMPKCCTVAKFGNYKTKDGNQSKCHELKPIQNTQNHNAVCSEKIIENFVDNADVPPLI